MYIASIVLNPTISVKPYGSSEWIQGQYRGKINCVSNEEIAYIAGFLDGDGSIMAQLIYRKDYKLGYQIRTSVVFYQKSNHKDILLWLQKQLGYGYVRDRNDGMSEYTIVGFREVKFVLKLLHPFLRLKKNLASEVLSIIAKYPQKITAKKLLRLAYLVDKTARFNYSKRRTNTSEVVKDFLVKQHLIPVETDSRNKPPR